MRKLKRFFGRRQLYLLIYILFVLGIGYTLLTKFPLGQVLAQTSYWTLQRDASSNNLNFTAPGGSIPVMGLTSVGNLGIGTVAPGAKLEISDGTNKMRFFPGLANVIRADDWGSSFEFRTTQGSGTTNNAQLYLGPTGSVGIGNPSPSQKLQVGNAGGGAASEGVIRTSTNNNAGGARDWDFGAGISNFGNWGFNIKDVGANANRLSIDLNGYVGIGMANPARPLNVKPSVANTPTLKLSQVTSDNGWGMFSDNANGDLVMGYDYGPFVEKVRIKNDSKIKITNDNADYRIYWTRSDGNYPSGLSSDGWGNVYVVTNGVNTTRNDLNGNLYIRGSSVNNGSPDVAEAITVEDETIEAGDVVSISNTLNPNPDKDFGQYDDALAQKSSSEYDSRVIGVISDGKSGIQINPYIKNLEPKDDPKIKLLAIAGRVLVKVSTENGAINPGDYLTSSSISGVAMKATKPGAVIGKALESYSSTDIGKILVLINISNADPLNSINELEQRVRTLEDRLDKLSK